MMIPKQDEFTGARVQALSMTIGLFTFVSVGIAGCIALVMGLFYLIVGFVMLLLQAITEMFSSMATIWIHADPLLKVVILAAVVYGGYRLYQYRVKKRGGK